MQLHVTGNGILNQPSLTEDNGSMMMPDAASNPLSRAEYRDRGRGLNFYRLRNNTANAHFSASGNVPGPFREGSGVGKSGTDSPRDEYGLGVAGLGRT